MCDSWQSSPVISSLIYKEVGYKIFLFSNKRLELLDKAIDSKYFFYQSVA